MVACEEDKWLELTIECKTLDEIDNAGPKEKWNAYICDATFDGEDVEDLEIPFWAMKPFWDLYVEAGKPKKGQLELTYLMSKKGDKRIARFRTVE